MNSIKKRAINRIRSSIHKRDLHRFRAGLESQALDAVFQAGSHLENKYKNIVGKLPKSNELNYALDNLESENKFILTRAWNRLKRFGVFMVNNIFKRLPRKVILIYIYL